MEQDVLVVESDNEILDIQSQTSQLEEIISPKVTLDPKELSKELDDLLQKWNSEEAEENVFDSYMENFEQKLAEELIIVGGATLEQISKEEKKLQEIEIQTRKDRAALERDQAEQELKREREAQLRLAFEIKRRKQEIDRKKHLFLLQQKVQREKMRHAMKKSESHLKWALNLRKGEVQREYGTLEPQQGVISSVLSALPKWSVECK